MNLEELLQQAETHVQNAEQAIEALQSLDIEPKLKKAIKLSKRIKAASDALTGIEIQVLTCIVQYCRVTNRKLSVYLRSSNTTFKISGVFPDSGVDWWANDKQNSLPPSTFISHCKVWPAPCVLREFIPKAIEEFKSDLSVSGSTLNEEAAAVLKSFQDVSESLKVIQFPKAA